MSTELGGDFGTSSARVYIRANNNNQQFSYYIPAETLNLTTFETVWTPHTVIHDLDFFVFGSTNSGEHLSVGFNSYDPSSNTSKDHDWIPFTEGNEVISEYLAYRFGQSFWKNMNLVALRTGYHQFDPKEQGGHYLGDSNNTGAHSSIDPSSHGITGFDQSFTWQNTEEGHSGAVCRCSCRRHDGHLWYFFHRICCFY